MRLSTIFVSSAFVLAGMSAVLPVKREDMLLARFADSDFLPEVEARAYDKEPELYAREDALSTLSGGKEDNRPGFRHPPSLPDYSSKNKSPSSTSTTYAAYDNQLVARGRFFSKLWGGLTGNKKRKGAPPSYPSLPRHASPGPSLLHDPGLAPYLSH